MRGYLPLLTVLCCCAGQLVAQSASRSDSVVTNTWYLYKGSAAPFIPLYNGAVYTAAYPGIKGSPFLADTMWHAAGLQYEGVFYPDVQLSYDLVADALLLKGAEPIALVPVKIGYFFIGDRHFVRINGQERNGVPTGLYELLVQQPDGNSLLVKRKKQPVRGFRAEDPYSFVNYNDFYVQRDGSYQGIDRARDLLQAAGKQKNALKKFLRDHHLQFKKNPEATLRKAMQFFMQNPVR